MSNEYSPFTSEDDDDDTSSAVESFRRYVARETLKKDEDDEEDSKESLWSALGKDKETKTEPEKPHLSEAIAEPVSAEEAPDDHLGAEEIPQIRAEWQEASAREREDEPIITPEQAVTRQALEVFDEQIASGVEPEKAANVAIASVGMEKPPEDEAEDETQEVPEADSEPTEATSEEPAPETAEPEAHEFPPEDEVWLNRPPAAQPEAVDTADDAPEPLQSGSGGGGSSVPPPGPGMGIPGPSPVPENRELVIPRAENLDERDYENYKRRHNYDQDDKNRYDQGNPAVTALIGGIIGYLIGRRRGRIKTEKRLLPIQKKLEKQVVDLHWELKRQEGRIRRAVHEQYKVEDIGPPKERPLPLFFRDPSKEQPKPKLEAPVPLAAQLERSEAIARQRAPEAQQLHVEQKPEHIGRVLVSAAETAPADTRESRKQEIDKIDIAPQRVETLNRTDLLELSQKIIVDGSSLREIYETHLVGEQGLRRLVAEHLRGGDLRRALKREVLEREIDFERDPAVRDMALSDAVRSSGGAQPNPGLAQLMNRAEASLPSSEEAAFYKAKANYEVQQRDQDQKRSRAIDASLAGAIVVLVGCIIYLFITR